MQEASNANVINAAKELMDEHAGGVKFHPLASAFQIGSIDAAYAVQHEYVRLQMASRGAGPVGYKVGLTSARMQEMWLATHLAVAGGGLRAGDIVMTGSLVTTKFPTESSHSRFDVGGLGPVELSVRM
jgi:2-keto-4-pentenoate hydratase